MIRVLIVHGYGAGPLQNLEIQKWWVEKGIASYALRLVPPNTGKLTGIRVAI